MPYLILAHDHKGMEAKREEVRDAHRTYLAAHGRKLLASSALLAADGMTVIGGASLFDTENYEEAASFGSQDPYAKAGIRELIDDLGVADNTIVVYTTDNGAEVLTWPDGGATPFKGDKATNWEGAFRVPCLISWPGVIKPGTIVNDVCAHEDFIPTFAAAAGEPDLVAKVLKGHTVERPLMTQSGHQRTEGDQTAAFANRSIGNYTAGSLCRAASEARLITKH